MGTRRIILVRQALGKTKGTSNKYSKTSRTSNIPQRKTKNVNKFGSGLGHLHLAVILNFGSIYRLSEKKVPLLKIHSSKSISQI